MGQQSQITHNLISTLKNTSSEVFGDNDSYWASGFLHGANGHDYKLLVHWLYLGNVAFSRASILDITEGSGYSQATNQTTDFTRWSATNGYFEATTSDGFWFGLAEESDPLTGLRTVGSTSDARWDVSFAFSPVLLNGGSGAFQANGTITEWSSPAGRATGSLWVGRDQEEVQIVPGQSIVWFDRQFGGVFQSWTWFELHVHSGGEWIPVSI